MTDDVPYVQIPVESVSREALDGLIDEFVSREGTDYGHAEYTFEQKRTAVRRQLDRGEVVIVFDPELESANLVVKEELDRTNNQHGHSRR